MIRLMLLFVFIVCTSFSDYSTHKLTIRYGVHIGDGTAIDNCNGIGEMYIEVPYDEPVILWGNNMVSPSRPNTTDYVLELISPTPEMIEFCECLVEHDPVGTFKINWEPQR